MDQNAKSSLFLFFAAENKRLQRYVRRRIHSIQQMDAEDIVADVMVNLFQKADITGGIENLAAYVYRSLQNRIVDYLRKQGKTYSLDTPDNEEEIPLLDRLSLDIPSVSDEVEQKILMQRLFTAIGKLEPKQRAVFLATEIKGISFRELSAQWNEPVGTLLSRKCRAVKALREMLETEQIK